MILLVTFFTSMTIYGQTEATINNIKYTLYKDSATVMQQSTSLSGDITIPEKVIYDNKEYTVSALVNKAFYQCSEIKSIKLPSSITNLSDDCFSQCTKLSSITFPSNIKSLGESCFYCCNSLTSILLPSSLTSIGSGCFQDCRSLTEITVPPLITKLDRCFISCESLKSVSLPSSITELNNACFSECTSLASISLPSSLKILGYACFYDCKSLSSIDIPYSVTSIDIQCFWSCTNLFTVKCHWTDLSKLSCNKDIFKYVLTNYATLYVPSGMKGEYATVSPWSSFNITENDNGSFEQPTEATINNINYALYKDSATVMRQNISISGDITIPEKVTYDNKEYTVSALVNKAFYQCSEIKSIKLPSSITNLSDDCFSQCTKLSSITFPSNIKSLGESCFYCCNSLTSILLPSSLTSIGSGCFQDCRSLTEITVPPLITKLDRCFISCESLKSVSLPSSITELNNACFSECTSLASISLPSSLKILGYACFASCKSLSSIDIPSSVTSIDIQCFWSCTNLFTVKCHWTDLSKLSCNKDIFKYVLTNYATLYVPSGMKEKYATVSPWSSFGTIIEDTPTLSEPISTKFNVISDGSCLKLSGLINGETIYFYSMTGALLGTAKASGDEMIYNTDSKDQIIIVKTKKYCVKVKL
jgi:hypothetical protein